MSSTPGPIVEGTPLWQPSEARRRAARITQFMDWLRAESGRDFGTYGELWRWSVESPEDFWAAAWHYFGIRASQPYERVLSGSEMPGARWFEGARLNFAEHALAADGEGVAIVHKSEERPLRELTWRELREQVGAAAAGLRQLGVGPGDRVAAYVPNMPEAVVAFLATASLGAVWSSCSPDFGTRSVVDRIAQIQPKVLIVADGYRYNGRDFDRASAIAELRGSLPTLESVVWISNLGAPVGAGALPWADLLSDPAPLSFKQVPFDHPLWILYSSGTTGMPKGIVHGHGGIVIDLLVVLGLQMDLGPSDRFFWFTTTGWVMWNIVVSSLLVGSTIVLYDGSPGYPALDQLWALAAEARVTSWGASAAYISSCVKAGLEPGREHDLSALQAASYTGSPLVPEHYGWIYEAVKPDIWFSSVSGGTDICGPFVGGCPILPVRAGEFQCRCLGVDVQAFDEEGRSVVGEVGELVVTKPMPSMPIHFWNDLDGSRYRESYFSTFPGVWRHGDWIKITPEGGAVIYGRSDSTINRMGVRMGSSELYRVVEELPEVLDSLVVDLSGMGRESYMPMFVVLADGAVLDDALKGRIRAAVRDQVSPRHVPDDVFAIPDVPRTLNNKKLEVPVRRILMGVPIEQAVNADSMSNPSSIGYFAEFAGRLSSRTESSTASRSPLS
ncbi:MAG TPA: acetoacetate--CoA ligase [Candidatus Dormibacteraeota bacterium]